MKRTEIIKEVKGVKTKSAWDKGVKDYAIDILENCYYLDEISNKKELLNGASDWSSYSWGGCALIYNEDIAQRLCNNTELKITKNGQRRPNKDEEWLDTQARALYQASNLIMEIIRKGQK